ncbi:MAG: group III truncated hemoglobin [Actinomycetota bacterium]|nr:group III truncated hemoglobin [Actinomycetota bacterium]
MTPNRDLTSRSEIHDLVIDFYREIVFDPMLGPVFDEVAEVDWAEHIPRLIDYWARVLLRDPSYDGFILRPHQHAHGLQGFELEYFDRWYALFTTSVDRQWRGPFADAAKGHAAHMAGSLARRILGVEWTAPDPVETHPEDVGASTVG